MSDIMINDIFDELFEENERLLDELLFAEECLNKFNELKTFSQFIFIRLKKYLNPNECQIFKDLTQDIDTKFAEKTMNYRKKYSLQNIGNSPQMSNLNESQESISREEMVIETEDINSEDINCEDGLESDEDYEPDVNLISDSEDEDVAIDGMLKCLEHDCGQIFQQRLDLVKHRNTCHSDSAALRLDNPSVHSSTTRFMCQVRGCGKTFKNQRCLRGHMMRFHPDVVKPKKSFECDDPGCEYKTTQAKYLMDHIENIHSTGLTFECTFEGCGKAFKSPKFRNRHEETHNVELSYVCDFQGCGKAFAVSGYLKKHEKRTHGRQLTFTDEDQELNPDLIAKYRKIRKRAKICLEPGCKFSAADTSDLKRHRLSVHSNEMPLECEVCHKRFKLVHVLRTHMKTHMKTHMGNKDIYRCDWPGCDYTANVLGSVVTHKKYVHSDERNFPCDWPECEKRFKSKQDLNQHLSRHKDDRRQVCSWPGCHYRCVGYSQFKNHMRTHSNYKPHACQWPGCQWRFVSSTGLNKHMKTHNKNKSI